VVDSLAKAAVRRHVLGVKEAEKAAETQKFNKEVVVSIGHFLQALPDTKTIYEGQKEAVPAVQQHSWQQVGDKWRCKDCLRQSATTALCRVACGTIPPSLRRAVGNDLGHKLMTTRTVDTDTWCLWCATCGGWASSRAFVLKEACLGAERLKKKSHARAAIAAVNRRLHPTSGEGLQVPWPILGVLPVE
jgi:hypothetical protein